MVEDAIFRYNSTVELISSAADESLQALDLKMETIEKEVSSHRGAENRIDFSENENGSDNAVLLDAVKGLRETIFATQNAIGRLPVALGHLHFLL